MNWEQIQTTIIAVCTSTVGSGVIAFIAYIIKDAIVHKIDSKKSKLLSSDKREIALAVQEGIKDGVEVDITSELDKATKKLISEQKDTINKLVKQYNEEHKLLVAMASVLSNLKSLQSTKEIADLKAQVEKASKEDIEELDNGRVVANVKVEVEEPKVEEKVSKIKY